MQAMTKMLDFVSDQHEQLSLLVQNDVIEALKGLQKTHDTARSQLYVDIAKQNAAHDKEKKAEEKEEKQEEVDQAPP